MDPSVRPVAVKAYVSWNGEPIHWSAHIERSEEDPRGESSEHRTASDAVAWARERTDWVLVVTDPLQWAGHRRSDQPMLPMSGKDIRDRLSGAAC